MASRKVSPSVFSLNAEALHHRFPVTTFLVGKGPFLNKFEQLEQYLGRAMMTPVKYATVKNLLPLAEANF